MAIKAIPPEDARRDQLAGALLVCAYESSGLFERNQLDGAISLESFIEQLPTLDRQHEIIFYCA